MMRGGCRGDDTYEYSGVCSVNNSHLSVLYV